MNNTLHETTKEIKQSLRLSMNGIVSAHQRRQGLTYKINFGVEIPRLKDIARQYEKSKELAVALWQENIRECKILAIFLLPEECYATLADKWIAETPFTEIADHLAMNILCKIPNVADKALQWCSLPDELQKYCGYLTLAHIARKGIALTAEQESTLYKLAAGLFDSNEKSTIKQCASKAICNYIDGDRARAERLLSNIAPQSTLAALIEGYI